MLEDRLNISLLNTGYQRLNSNTEGIYLFHRTLDNEYQVISVIRALQGNELSAEQYEHILEQIKANFKGSYPHNVKLLSLIITANPEGVRRLATERKEDSHWIVDVRANRLMIYEMHNTEYADIQRLLEQLLTEEQLLQNREYGSQDSYRQPVQPSLRATYRYLLTPVTMGIIAVNIVAYLVSHYTSLFGGPDAMLAKGALSWYYVMDEKEYYRILTSIFMHGDWSHLVNNMLVLLFVGGNLERIIGRLRYLFVYFASGIVAGISSIGYNMWKEYAEISFYNTTISIGASGAIFGVVGAVLFIVIINRGRLREISTRQMLWFVVLSLYNGAANSRIDQAAHVGGFIAGFLFAVILYRKHRIDTGN